MPAINPEFVVPFLDATQSTFRLMMNREVRRTDVYIKKNHVMFGDISGEIGMSGHDVCGTASISLPAPLAIACVCDMLGESKENVSDLIIRDGVGEMINMIAGGAKTTFGNTKYRFDISLPTIISGHGHEIYHKNGTTWLSTIFETKDKDEFSVDVCVNDL